MAAGALVLRCKRCGRPFETFPVPMMKGDNLVLQCGCPKKLTEMNYKWLGRMGLLPPIQPQRLPDRCEKCGAARRFDVTGPKDGRVVILRCGGTGDGDGCNAIYHLDTLTGTMTLVNPD